MKKLIKRADGSKSPRGLWDNIRANKGSGKKPTKEMLKQEAKIKKEENMKEYKNGGKKSAKVMKEAKREKESFITESKELKFGNKPMPKEEKEEMKSGGKKTMEPGGGGRFAKLVNKMKGQGKSEESAKAIAASIGRKKYGKSKFQEMAAAGKKKMGGKKC